MTPALAFILSAFALLAVVTGMLCVALWRGAQAGANAQAAQATQNDPVQTNAAVYRDQLAELDEEHAQGLLSDHEWHLSRDELAARLLQDVGEQGTGELGATSTTPVKSDAAAMTHSSSASSRVTSFAKPWVLLFSFVVLIPTGSLVLYSLLGQPAALDPLAISQGLESPDDLTPEKLTTMATALTRRLQDEPNSMEGWVMLARVQRAREHFDEAAAALRKALTLSRDDDLQIELAEILAQQNKGVFAGEPWSIIQKVLATDPHHVNALLLGGSAAYSEQNFQAALRFWERAREVVAADSPDAPELDRAIGEARNKLGLPAIPARAMGGEKNASNKTTGTASGSTNASNNANANAPSTQRTERISGRVSVAPDLANKVAPTDTVFIYATPVAGSRMPLAIVKITANQLPYDFVLDDTTAMNPSAKLSGMDEVTVRARISKSGNAMQQPSDLGVSVTPVKPGSAGLNLMVRETLR
ncbi:MAG: Cytochrome c-type biosis protein CcmH precursor [Pseudomonadota bacterium]